MNQKAPLSTITKILSHFAPGKVVSSVDELSVGHIHRTYRVSLANQDNILLQAFSTAVFPLFKTVAQNTDLVIEALKKSDEYRSRYALSEPIRAIDGEIFFKDNEQTLWRCFTYLNHTKTFMNAPSAEVVFNAATAFAQFQRATITLSSSQISDPLIGFMDNPGRLKSLQMTIKEDAVGRAAAVKPQLQFIDQHQALFSLMSKLHEDPQYKLRLTHGDMKLNNVLFHENSTRVAAIIDLDTCMMGDYLYDYGDFMRVACNTAVEDEPDLTAVTVNVECIKAAVEGFLSEMNTVLIPEEKNSLSKAPAALALTIGCRFLTDYLQGDTYFRIEYPEHNLVRAKSQLMLCQQFLNHEQEIKKLIA